MQSQSRDYPYLDVFVIGRVFHSTDKDFQKFSEIMVIEQRVLNESQQKRFGEWPQRCLTPKINMVSFTICSDDYMATKACRPLT